MITATRVQNLTRRVIYPESPRWHEERIWFSDVHDYRIKAVSLEGELEVITQVDDRPAGLGVMPDGSLLVASAMTGRVSQLRSGRLAEVTSLAGLITGLLNDMVTDGRGRAFVGDTGFRYAAGEPQAPGRILACHPDGSAWVAAEGLAFPNGMAITDDESTLYVAETLGRRITAFSIEDDGRLTARRTVADLDFRPDGVCLDEGGHLWVAATSAGKFVQVHPDGAITGELASPGNTAVACVFGGPGRSRLVLCSADTAPDRLARGISHGRVDIADAGVRGGGRP